MKTRSFALLACLALPVSAAADQEFVNEEWVIAHGETRPTAAFNLGTAPAVIHVTVTGVKNTDKGFTARLVPAEDYDACVGNTQGRCRSRPGFDAFKVAAMDHGELVPSGRWVFYVQNSENRLERATVHVHLSIAR